MEELCRASRNYELFYPLIVIEWVDMGLALTSMILVVFVAKTFLKKQLSLHVNFKIVLLAAGFTYFVQALSVLLLKSYSRYQFYLMPDGCGGVFYRYQCIFMRAPLTFSVVGVCMCHFALFFERACATYFTFTYEKAAKGYAIGFIFACFLVVVGWVFWVYCDDDLYVLSANCTSTYGSSGSRVLTTFYIILVVDIFCTTGDCILYFLSKRRLRRQQKKNISRSSSPSYRLNNEYQLRENRLTTTLVFPLSVIHSTFFIVYVFGYTRVRVMYAAADRLTLVSAIEASQIVMYAYEVALLVVLLFLHDKFVRNQKSRVKPLAPQMETDLYFKLFDRQLR